MEGGTVHKILRQLLRSKPAVIGGFLVLVFLFLAFFGPSLAPHDPFSQDIASGSEPPSMENPMGRDRMGRDMFSRILHGTRYSVIMAVSAVTVGLTIGALMGLCAGFYGGIVDVLLMRVVDLMLAFPAFFVALIVVAILGPGLLNGAIAVGIASVPHYARVIRGGVLTVKGQEFVEAARAQGASNLRIMFRHVLPNCVGVLLVQTTLRIGAAVITSASLSFLGLGAQEPLPEWGLMVSAGRDYLRSAPHIAVFPGLCIAAMVLGFNLLGDGLRDILDPKFRD